MSLLKKVHKNTLLLILIFILGVIAFIVYINASFKTESKVQTSTLYETSKSSNS